MSAPPPDGAPDAPDAPASDGPGDRLDALAATGLLDTPPEEAFDRLTDLVRRALGVPVALVSLVDADRQFFKSARGLAEPWCSVRETPLSHSFCRHVVEGGAPLAVEDAREDGRVRGNLAVRDLGVVAYLGVPLRTPGGVAVGSLCAIDSAPRAWTAADREVLEAAAEVVAAEIAGRYGLRRRAQALAAAHQRGEALFRALFDGVSQLTGLLAPDGTVLEANRTALAFAGLDREAVVGRPLWEALPLPPEMEGRHRDALAQAAAGEPVRYEETVWDGRGRRHVLDVTLRPALGTPGLLLLEGRDVTEAVRLRSVQSAMTAGGAGTWEVDLRTGAVVTHGGTDALFGLDPEGGPYPLDAYYARLHPDDAAGARDHLGALAERGGEYEVERRVLGPEGSVRHVRSRGAVLRGPDGAPARLVGAVADVTGQREREAAVRANERRLALALGTARLGTFEHDPASGRTSCDARTQALLGLPAEPPFEAFLARVHPDDRAAVTEAVGRLAEDPEAGPIRVPYRVVGGPAESPASGPSDGPAGGPARHVVASIRGVAGEGGRLERVIGAVQDVSDQVAAEAAVRESADHLRAVLDGLSAFVAVLEPDGALVSLNRPVTEVSGVRAEDVAGAPFWDGPWWAHSAEVRRRVRDACRQAAEGEPSRFDTRAEVAGGALLPIDFSVRPLLDGAGRVTHLVASAVDLSEREAAAAALRESEARLSAVLDALPVGVIIADADGRIVRDNAANRAIWGVPPETEGWEGYGEWAGYWPDSGRRLAAGEWAMARALRTGETVRGETVEVEPFGGGARRTILNSAAPVRDGAGRTVGGVVAQLDVTEQLADQRALRESEERLRAVLDATDAVIYTKDLDGRYTLVNRAWAELFGREPASILGRTDHDYLPPETVGPLRANDQAVAEAGRPLQFEEHAEVGGEPRTYLSVKFPLRDDAGAVVATGGISSDITPLRRAAEALQASEARFRGTFENAAVGIAHVGLDGAWLRANDRLGEIVGYDPEELLGRTFQAVTHPDDAELDLDEFRRLVAGELDHYQVEKRYVHRDGHTVWINLTVAPSWGPDGAVEYVIAVVEDVSDKKAAEAALVALNDALEDRVEERTAELARSNAELDQFAYVASHDLKAPLRAIDSLATWIEEDAGAALPPESARHLGLLRQRAARMEGLLDGLLAYSRAGRQEAAPEPIDTGALARDVVATVAPPEGFDVRLVGDFPTVETARAPLALVLRNLVGNAIKHHDRPDGRVTVSAEAVAGPDGAPLAEGASGADGWAAFTVEDDGPGIAPEYRDRVFGMFQTLRPRDEVEGSGMGLAIVKKTVEGRGGRVTVGAADGGGARFRFTWPLWAGGPPPA